MIEFLIYALTAFFTVYALYFVATGILGFIKPHKSHIKRYSPKHKFGILIAARNEEKVIGSLIQSLQNQDYPKELYDIFVIPNNCTDNTKEVALDNGAIVLNCKVPVKSKGDVLKYIYKKLRKNKDLDAYIIFDADNVVHKDFLKRMNDALCDGYEVAQGNRDSKNPNDNWITGSFSIYYWMQNIFVNKSRMYMKSAASINGTGFMVKKSVIDEYGFDPTTLTEDLEFTAQCILNDKTIAYVEDAITYDEQAFSFKDSIFQRSRWTSGNIQCLSKYGFNLIKEFFKTGKIMKLDLWIKFLMPINHVFGILMSVISFVYFNRNDMHSVVFVGSISLLVSYLAQVFFGIFLVVYYRGKDWYKTISGILLFPIFLITWIPISIKCFFVTDRNWKEVKHTRNIKIHELS